MDFNNMTPGDTLAPFVCFGITALADFEGVIMQADAESRSLWGIYGQDAHGETFPIHDAAAADEIAQAAAEIERQTGKPFYYGDGARPNTTSGTLIELCEHLTFAIHEEIPGHDDDPETFRDDDFDAHPLAELREALCTEVFYDGQAPDAAERHAAEQDEITAAWEEANPAADPRTPSHVSITMTWAACLPMLLACYNDSATAQGRAAALKELQRMAGAADIAAARQERAEEAAELATILAALRLYQSEGMGDPDNRPADIHEIATNCGDVISLDAEGIDTLCEKLNARA